MVVELVDYQLCDNNGSDVDNVMVETILMMMTKSDAHDDDDGEK